MCAAAAACVVQWYGVPASAGDVELPGAIAKVLAGYKVPHDAVSLLVQDLDADTPALSLNAGVMRNPASTIKLFTTAAALNVLGPTYTWSTKLYAQGPIENGVLNGDLVLKGHGDPFLVIEEFWKLVGELRRTGIETIKGDLVIDDSHFEISENDPGDFDQRPHRLYNVVPNASLVNFKAVDFQFTRAPDGKSVLIQTYPPLPNLSVTNKLSIKKSRCRGYQLGIRMDVPDPERADHVVFSGTFPSACRTYSMKRSVLEPDSYAYGLFKMLWEQWGGKFDGGVRKGTAPDEQAALVEWQSRPLGETIRAANKWSNNLVTRLLLYSLASAKFEPPYTKTQGIEVLYDYLNKSDIGTENVIIDNGAGLSRGTRVTADNITRLLRHAYRGPYMAEFVSSMSLNGLDGTTRKRFNGKPEAGRMHLKTGRLDDVAAIAGYVIGSSGKIYTVVLLINHGDIHRGPGVAIQDTVLRWVHTQ